MTSNEHGVLWRGVAAGVGVGLALGLLLALFVVMRPEMFAALAG